MSSYAPLLAKDKHTSWNPDLIYFSNTEVRPTANYYVQRAFGQNDGDTYVYSDIQVDYDPVVVQKDRSGRVVKNAIGRIAERIDRSVVINSKTGDVIVKLVSLLPEETKVSIDLGKSFSHATQTVIKSGYDATSGVQSPDAIKEWESMDTSIINDGDNFTVTLPAYSMIVIRYNNDDN